MCSMCIKNREHLPFRGMNLAILGERTLACGNNVDFRVICDFFAVADRAGVVANTSGFI